jgi:5'-3' exonuclease
MGKGEIPMTDNEIIKALECCTKVTSLSDCIKSGCPAKKREGCFYYLRTDDDFEGVIFVELIKDAIDLINRQKADKEKLEYILMGVMHSVDKWLEGEELNHDETNRAVIMREKTLQIVEKQQAEIEMLRGEDKEKTETIDFLKKRVVGWNNDYCELKMQIKTAKVEAIKEFAERLKEKAIENYIENLIMTVDADEIDNLVKEMVGDNDA